MIQGGVPVENIVRYITKRGIAMLDPITHRVPIRLPWMRSTRCARANCYRCRIRQILPGERHARRESLEGSSTSDRPSAATGAPILRRV